MSTVSYAEVVQKTNSDETHAQTDGLLEGVSENVNKPLHGNPDAVTPTSHNEKSEGKTSSSEKKDSLTRIQSIPVVQETLDRVMSIIKSNNLLAALYARGEQMTQLLYNHTRSLVNPVLSTADIYASKGLDAFEKRYPNAFQASTEDVLKTAHMPVDFAVDSFRTRLEGAQASLVAVQDRLSSAIGSVAEKVPRSQEDAQKAAQDYYSELVKLRDQTKSQIADAPENVKTVYEPLLASLQNGIDDVNKILMDKEVPVTERATKVATYSRENLPKVVSDTLTHLKGMVISKKEEVQKKASE